MLERREMRRVIAVILAAGQGRRMGRPKQFLSYGDGTMLEAVIDAVLQSSVDGLVVVGNPAVKESLRERLPERCCVVVNDDPASEMLASVKLGVRAVREVLEATDDDGVMVLLADQPQVTAGTITTCVEAYRLPKRTPGILIATYNKRRGHPAIFSCGLLGEIENWGAERKLSELAALHPEQVRQLPITTGPLPMDVNTPEDYRRLEGRD